MIQPKAQDDSWQVVPNLWGAIVAEAGMMKSPVINAVSSLTAKAYRSYLRKWISPRWGKYLVADLAKPQLRSAIEAWLADLAETGKLAPKIVRSIGSLMRLIFRRAVKWGYL